MRCSANEIMTLAAKAARGAGAPPAQAAAFGAAAACHLRAGNSADDLSRALSALPNGPILEFPVMITRAFENAVDDVASGEIKTGPFADLALSYAGAQPVETKSKFDGGNIQFQMFLSKPNMPPPTPRITIPDDLVAELHTLAARILVPESEISRLSGAGAGLTDND
jgi:hypothetical protein